MHLRVMGIWTVFHTLCLAFIKVLAHRRESEVGKSSRARAQHPQG